MRRNDPPASVSVQIRRRGKVVTVPLLPGNRHRHPIVAIQRPLALHRKEALHSPGVSAVTGTPVAETVGEARGTRVKSRFIIRPGEIFRPGNGVKNPRGGLVFGKVSFF